MNGLEISCLAYHGVGLLITMFVMRGMPFPSVSRMLRRYRFRLRNG
jgi:hypothetical protein